MFLEPLYHCHMIEIKMNVRHSFKFISHYLTESVFYPYFSLYNPSSSHLIKVPTLLLFIITSNSISLLLNWFRKQSFFLCRVIATLYKSFACMMVEDVYAGKLGDARDFYPTPFPLSYRPRTL